MNARVVGAGLSGLIAAVCLADRGADVEVVEAASGPGGLIDTIATPHGLVERAANAFIWDDTVARWFTRLKIAPQFASPDSRRRYIFRDGRARRWPLTAVETARTVASVASTMLRREMTPRFDETVDAFGRRVAGDAATTWLLGAALQGIYAAPATRLSAEAIFGNRRRRRGRMRSAAPPGGMGQFVERLYATAREAGVSFTFGRALEAIDRDTPTVAATNAPAAARLLQPHTPPLAAAIRGVSMTHMVTATAFYEPHRDDLKGFGVLFPRDAGISALGVLFNGVVFGGRSRYRLETWIYGAPAGDPGVPAASDVDATIAADRQRLTGRTQAPIACYATRQSPALPIYDSSVLAIARQLDTLPSGIALAGNYLGEIGVARLIARAERAAKALTSSRR